MFAVKLYLLHRSHSAHQDLKKHLKKKKKEDVALHIAVVFSLTHRPTWTELLLMFVTGFAEDYFDKHVSPQDKKNMIQCCELCKNHVNPLQFLWNVN